MTARPKEPSEPPRRPLRVLYADDSEDSRFLVEAYFRSSPHHVDIVADGEIACKRFLTTRYDLVLMDVHMPIVDGLTAALTMRAWEREQALPKTPIVALTANRRGEALERCRRAGYSDHLAKPITKKTLLALVDRYAVIRETDRLTTSDALPHATPPEGAVVPDRRLVVAVDRDLLPLMPRYLKSRQDDAERLLRAVAESDFDVVWTLGHNMAGSGSSFGLGPISDVGTALVRAAEERDHGAASRLAHELARLLDSIDIVCAEEPLADAR